MFHCTFFQVLVEQLFCKFFIWCFYTQITYLIPLFSFYSEPLFCSLGVAPFVTAIVIGIMGLSGTLFTTFLVEKVFYFCIYLFDSQCTVAW